MTRVDEIRRYNVESDMAFGHLQWEDFDAAEKQLEMCLEQYKKWGSEEDIPFEYLKYNHIISYVCMSQGTPVEAVKHAKKGAALGEVCAGLMHPMTQLVRISLSNHLYLANEMEECEKEIRGVLSARAKKCGEFNCFTLEGCSFCAFVLAQRGKYEEAERLYIKCLDRQKRSVWNQKGISRAQFLYARTLTALRQKDEEQLACQELNLSLQEIADIKQRILDRNEEAKNLLRKARDTKRAFLKDYPQWLKDDVDELAVLDQMCCMWAGRYTGKLKAGADKAANLPLEELTDARRDSGVEEHTSLPVHSR